MAAVTRWVEYLASETGDASEGDGTVYGAGTRGYWNATASVGDTFNIGTANNRLYLTIDGVVIPGNYITLASGTDLSARFVAKDITEKIHALGSATKYQFGQCVWVNDDSQNHFELYSGSLGAASSIVVSSGVNTAHLELGWGTHANSAGASLKPGDAGPNNYNQGLTVSGTYRGFFDEIYHIVINKVLNIGTPSQGGGNTYTGDITTGGVFNDNEDFTYVISIDTTGGKTTMGAGPGLVPTMEWTGEGSVSGPDADNSSSPIDLLYPNYWYRVGTKGLMVKFTDAVFNTCDPAWTIVCTACAEAYPGNAQGPAGTARYIWGSNRGDDAGTFYTTQSGSWTELGSRGLYIKFNGTNNFAAGDEFYVVCSPPQPYSYDISNLNYGNVTVSTESPVKVVMFEILSGAVEISTVKFGLQSDGSFSHHNEGNSDTYFRFGTVGPGNNAGSAPHEGCEWRESITAADISSDIPPSYLFATEDNLSVVLDADSSEAIGVSAYAGMVADPMWLNIKLGSSEVGANSTINYRIYFDYS